MTLSFPSAGFDEAIAAVCHGLATETEMRALNELLRSNSSARDEYLLRIELHARLASDPDLFSHAADKVASGRLPSLSTGDRRDILLLNSAVPATGRRLIQAPALAACLMLMAAGVWALWLKRSVTRNGVTSNAIATLTRAVDARWNKSTGPLRVGSALEPRVLRLKAGLAQVVFYSGARVVISRAFSDVEVHELYSKGKRDI